MFYEFDQNNSGGSFTVDDKAGIGPGVWIEANSADEANSRAEDIGIYFNGCDKGWDCPCCGDRWYPTYGDDDGTDKIVLNEYSFNWHDTVYLHTLDGEIHRANKADNLLNSPIGLLVFDGEVNE